MKAPDSRGWVAIGLFAMSFFVIALLAWKPELARVELFAVLGQAVVISGLIGGPVVFLYGSSKGSADKDQTIAALTPKDDAS